MESNDNNMKLGITVDEARKMLGIGRNLMLQLVKLDGFPAVRFKRKIIINKELLPKWFAENYGQYGEHTLKYKQIETNSLLRFYNLFIFCHF